MTVRHIENNENHSCSLILGSKDSLTDEEVMTFILRIVLFVIQEKYKWDKIMVVIL
jgi:hypothetical protein